MRQIPLVLATTILAGCALTGGNQLPVCDGKHPRPANPNGSVLTPAAADRPGAAVEDSGQPMATAGSPPARRCR